jgi:hypothetical protein
MHTEWKMPSWWNRDKKPPSDRAYFENLTCCIFQAGLRWRTIDNKWPNFVKAFQNLDLSKVSAYGSEDKEQLTKDKSIVRNRVRYWLQFITYMNSNRLPPNRVISKSGQKPQTNQVTTQRL